MKIRMNYVSNSSSSSFVAVGYLIDDDRKMKYYELSKKLKPEIINQSNNLEEYINEYGLETFSNGVSVIAGCDDNGFSEGKTFVGKFIAKGDSDSDILDDKIVDINEVEDDLKEFNFKNEKLKVITGFFLN